MARNVFLGNALTRLPFPGVAALYRALFDGASGQDKNPMFYVSSSPWNIYDLLSQFFYLQRIPVGPVLFLRDWGITENEILPVHNREYKVQTIRQMIEFYPHLPFILIGDSDTAAPEIYAELVETYPHRIQAIYIRNVSRSLKRPEAIRELARGVVEAGSALVLADDSLTIGKHAVEQGYIGRETLTAIGVEKVKDEAPPTVIEKMLGEPGKAEAPTVEVSRNVVKDGAIEETMKEAGKETTTKPPTVVVEGEKAKQQKAEQDTPALHIDEKKGGKKKNK
jgi:phosphatidate phosphatase APP1